MKIAFYILVAIVALFIGWIFLFRKASDTATGSQPSDQATPTPPTPTPKTTPANSEPVILDDPDDAKPTTPTIPTPPATGGLQSKADKMGGQSAGQSAGSGSSAVSHHVDPVWADWVQAIKNKHALNTLFQSLKAVKTTTDAAHHQFKYYAIDDAHYALIALDNHGGALIISIINQKYSPEGGNPSWTGQYDDVNGDGPSTFFGTQPQ